MGLLVFVAAVSHAAPGASVAELEAEVVGLDARAAAAAAAQAVAEQRERDARAAVAQNTVGLKEARRNREHSLAALEQRLVGLYVTRRPSPTEVILSTGSIGAALDQVALLNRIGETDAALFRQVLETRERLAQSRAELIEQRGVATRQAGAARERRAMVDALLTERRAVLVRARSELAQSQAGAAAERAAAAPARRPSASPDAPPANRGACHPAPPASVAAHLAKIAQCESGGNPRAISPSGLYRGKYQFHRATWESVGGSGDPAAASEAEQDHRAALLYAREGPAPWPICGS